MLPAVFLPACRRLLFPLLHAEKGRKIGDVYTQASCVLVICCLTSNAYHAGYALSTTRLLKTIFGLAGYRRFKAARNLL